MSAKILVVDDEAGVRSVIQRILEREGYEVLPAEDAHTARTLLMKQDDGVDLVVMDLVLPGLEGQEAANLLKARQPGLKVIYMSGYSSRDSIRTGSMREGEPFLRKPFEPAELLQTVRDALT